jgi:hypothetical protein
MLQAKMSAAELRSLLPQYMAYQLFHRCTPYVVIGWHAQSRRDRVPYVLLKISDRRLLATYEPLVLNVVANQQRQQVALEMEAQTRSRWSWGHFATLCRWLVRGWIGDPEGARHDHSCCALVWRG